MVTDPGPAITMSNAARLPGNTSVMVSVGVQTPGAGVGVGLGVGVGFGVGVGVGFGVGVGKAPAHRALMDTAFIRDDARKMKSTGCPGLGIVNVAVTGLNVPGVKIGTFTFALVALTNV